MNNCARPLRQVVIRNESVIIDYFSQVPETNTIRIQNTYKYSCIMVIALSFNQDEILFFSDIIKAHLYSVRFKGQNNKTSAFMIIS